MNYDHEQLSVKKPKDDQDLTEDQEKEWIRCADNLDYFLKTYVYTQGQRGRVLFNPRPYQKRFYRGIENNDFVCLLSGRQTGKSTSTVGYLLHEMIFNQDMKVGVTSYKLANCKDLMARFKFAYENLPFWLKPPVIEYNRYSVAFTNGSSIEAQVTRENTFRGNTPKIIYIDELAFVKPSVAEEFWGGLLPSLTAEGEDADVKLIITSTPNGSGDLFSSIWFGAVAGTNGFFPVEVKYDEVPGRTEKFKKDMISKFGLTKFLQEFCNHFISDKGTLINSQILEDMKSEDPIFYPDDSLYMWEKDLKGKNIAISIDVSEGIGKDYHAMHITDVDNFVQVGEYRNNTLTQTHYVKAIISVIDLCFRMGAAEVYYTVENNSIGMGVINLLQNTDSEALDSATFISHVDYPNKLGMPTNTKTKPHGCQRLKDMVELEKYTIKSSYLINELKFFVKNKGSFAAESGKTDDLCMAAVLMMLLLEQIGDYEESAYEKMSEVSYDQEQDAYEVGIFV